MPFRLKNITVAERIELVCTCLLSNRQYGRVTELAREYGTSRQFLYALRHQARSALELALAPGTPGRPPLEQRLVIDDLALDRAILVLSQAAHASVRAIQECLGQILQVPRSLGAIHAVLAEAATRARALRVVPTGPVHVVADETFAAHRPVLEVVEHQSGAVLALSALPARDETAWGCTLLDVIDPGVTIDRITADGDDGLRAGVRALGLADPALDHWHTVRDLGRLAQVLEHAAYRRLATAERAQREAAAGAYRQAHGRRPGSGRPLKVASDPASVERAIHEADAAIRRADGGALIRAAVQEVLPPLDRATGRLHRPEVVLADLRAAAALLRELGGRAVEAATFLEERAERLVAYLGDLEAQLREARAVLGEDVVAFLAWAWQHRRELGLREAAEAWPAAPEPARQVWVALDEAVRTTGMAENLNSLLAAHRAAHRGLPDNVLAVFAVYRNHHAFQRGKRGGNSPLELLGLPSPDWLDVLGYGCPALEGGHGLSSPPIQTVNTLAA
jgi:hypothetical protein